LLLTVKIDWDIDAVADMTGKVMYTANTPKEDKLREHFPALNLGRITTPTTVVDAAGRIILWYLPHIMPKELTVCLSSCLLQTYQPCYALGSTR
jgi:hypothetical protein